MGAIRDPARKVRSSVSGLDTVQVFRPLAATLMLAFSSCSVMEVAHDIPCTVGGKERVVRVWIGCTGPSTGLYGAMFDYLIPIDALVSPVASVVGLFDSRARTVGPWWLGPIPHVAATVLPGVTSLYEHGGLSKLHLRLPTGATLPGVRAALEEHQLHRQAERRRDGTSLSPPPWPIIWGPIGELVWLN